MSSRNSIIKSELLTLFNNGKSESEAHEEINKILGSRKIYLKTVNKWFEKFKAEGSNLGDNKVSTKQKLTDEYLINLVDENPNLSIAELAKIASVSESTITKRIRQINDNGGRVNYSNRNDPKFTDEYLINLINENPDLNMAGLAKITGSSQATISCRIKRIRANGERINYYNKSSSKFTDEYLINLVNENPDLNLAELAKIAGSSQAAVSCRIKRIKDSGEKINYCSKAVIKLTDECLIDLVNSNPHFSMPKLGKATDTSASTINHRIKKINKNGEEVKYTKKQHKPEEYIKPSSKLTDEFMVKLVKENPDLSMERLAYLENVSAAAISTRINRINNSSKTPVYQRKDIPKLTDKALVDLINKNPELNMTELAELAGTSQSTISRRNAIVNNSGKGTNYSTKKVQISEKALIELINKNPELNMKELAKLAGFSESSIRKKVAKINESGEKVYYNKKNKQKISDEALIELINKNPGLDRKQLAEVAGIGQSTLSARIKQINSGGEVINHVKKQDKNKGTKTN